MLSGQDMISEIEDSSSKGEFGVISDRAQMKASCPYATESRGGDFICLAPSMPTHAALVSNLQRTPQDRFVSTQRRRETSRRSIAVSLHGARAADVSSPYVCEQEGKTDSQEKKQKTRGKSKRKGRDSSSRRVRACVTLSSRRVT